MVGGFFFSGEGIGGVVGSELGGKHTKWRGGLRKDHEIEKYIYRSIE